MSVEGAADVTIINSASVKNANHGLFTTANGTGRQFHTLGYSSTQVTGAWTSFGNNQVIGNPGNAPTGPVRPRRLDVIMVGEMRDNETAQIGVHAALTGHLVLTTLHTNTAVGAIPRLIDMGVESFFSPPAYGPSWASASCGSCASTARNRTS
jgi:hypothetical protein